MKIIDRLKRSLSQRRDRVILRSEWAGMCSPSQLTNALNQLIKEGLLARVSSGVYTKARAGANDAPLSGTEVQALTSEAFKKLGRTIQSARTQSDQNQDVLLVDGGRHRLSRQFKWGQASVEYAGQKKARTLANRAISLPEDLNALPLKNVSAFVQRFAMSRDVHFKSSGLDQWAEAVTRASGDDVTLDETGKLLVALKKKQLINGRQMARLMSNHLSEQRGLDGAHSADDNMAYAADDQQAKQRYEEASQRRKRSQQA